MTTTQNIKNAIPSIIDAELLETRGINYTSWDEDNSNCAHWNNCVSFQFSHKEVKNPFWITLFAGANKISNYETFVKPSYQPTIKDGYVDETVLYGSHKKLYEAQGVSHIKEIVESFDILWFTEDKDLDNTPLIYNDADALYTLADSIMSEHILSVSLKINKSKPSIEKIEMLEKTAKEARELYNKYQSKERCNFVYNDQDAPKALVEFMKKRNINCVESEKIVYNEGYMPDSAIVVKLTEKYEHEPYAEFIFDEVGEFELMYASDYTDRNFLQNEFGVDKNWLKEIESYLDKVRKINEPVASEEMVAKNEIKTVYCDCCESAYVTVFNRDQKSHYVCTMCRENEPERFQNVENTRDVDKAINYANV